MRTTKEKRTDLAYRFISLSLSRNHHSVSKDRDFQKLAAPCRWTKKQNLNRPGRLTRDPITRSFESLPLSKSESQCAIIWPKTRFNFVQNKVATRPHRQKINLRKWSFESMSHDAKTPFSKPMHGFEFRPHTFREGLTSGRDPRTRELLRSFFDECS